MARAYRRMQAVMDAGGLKGLLASEMRPEERQFFRLLLRDEKKDQLCCGEAEERWFEWYQKQSHGTWTTPRWWTSCRMMEDAVLTIERLTDAGTPLEEVMRDLHRLTYLSDGRALDFVLRPEHPNALSPARCS